MTYIIHTALGCALRRMHKKYKRKHFYLLFLHIYKLASPPPPQDLGLVGCDSWNTWVCMFRGYNSKCKTQLSWILLTAIHILCMITHGSFVWEVGLLVLMVFAWLHNLHIYIYFVFQALVLTATVSSNKTQITSSYCTCITEITNCNYLFPFETKSITRV